MDPNAQNEIRTTFEKVCPKVGYANLRFVHNREEILSVQRGIPDPVQFRSDHGAMVTVAHDGGYGYCATNDLREEGLAKAFSRAKAWAEQSKKQGVIQFDQISFPHPKGEYKTAVKTHWDTISNKEKLERLTSDCEKLKTDPKIVDWQTSLWFTESNTLFLTNQGGDVAQKFHLLVPLMTVTANQGPISQSRTLGGHSFAQQAGLEFLEESNFTEQAATLSQEALELLVAPNCPTGEMDLLLAPDQMILQIHESVGHPLELDRILGDERNYAGRSFVQLGDFGKLQYGSKLMNITFDPDEKTEFSTYGFDDDGVKAKKEFLIKNGKLLRSLGGTVSQARTKTPGLGITRACSWNRPPIDRIANLNLEPGDSSFDEMIQSVDNGIFMKTNCSWSIDDSRNKFQFGCEWARLIENGKLTKLVRNPNYRGISSSFWKSLKMVGNRDTFEVMGTPFCGKGEPNQAIRVGHASPTALFEDVQVFGGE